MEAITKSPRIVNAKRFNLLSEVAVCKVCISETGSIHTIPAKIRTEIPFPTPFSVISSPSQTKSIVPATIVAIKVTRSRGDKKAIIP